MSDDFDIWLANAEQEHMNKLSDVRGYMHHLERAVKSYKADRDRLAARVRELEEQLRKIATGEDPGRPVPPHGSGP